MITTSIDKIPVGLLIVESDGCEKMAEVIIFSFIIIVPKEDVIIEKRQSKISHMHCFKPFLNIFFHVKI
jgi:hypothetical protein